MTRSTTTVPLSSSYAEPRNDWLELVKEPALEPELPIIDSHHHLWDRNGTHYLFDEFHEDVNSGHNVVATVYAECRSMYRADGPAHLKSVGEVEFANGAAAMSESGGYGRSKICAAVVGSTDFRQGKSVGQSLEALIHAGNGRFRGIRQTSAWDADPEISTPMASRPKGLLLDETFRKGFKELHRYGLSFDAFLYHPQISELTDLARHFPETPIVLDHLGGPLGIGPYARNREEVFASWGKAIRELARCENVYLKIGGLGMVICGFGFHLGETPPNSRDLVNAWKSYVDLSVDAFGPHRCMLESNFPPDKGSYSYGTLWNAFKLLTLQYSDAEREAMFSGTARQFYRLD